MEKKTNSALVAYARRALREGWVYWYGTTGRPCTESLLKRKRAQYPAHYGSARTAAYRRHIAEKRYCADCINLVKGYMWLDEATGKQGYAINGCPDTNADGMFARAAQKGSIETMPDVPGLIVRFSGHAGVYVGEGRVIEARGFAYGVVETALSARPWTHWYEMPGLSYGAQTPPQESVLGSRVLWRGSRGEDVRLMQEMLLRCGYALPKYGSDGDFGAESEAALKSFQEDNALTIDGVYSARTHAALLAASREDDDETREDEAPQPVGTLEITGARVYVRGGPGTRYDPVTVVARGTRLAVLGESGGWHCVSVNGKSGWVGPRYARLTDA